MATHVNARIYGEITGAPPFQNKAGATAFSGVKPYPSPQVASLPTEGTTFWGLPNGTLVGNNYVYSVIEVPQTGLVVDPTYYACDQSAAALATSAG